MAHAQGTIDDQTVMVGGAIKRVAIITTALHPCACYLARRLRACDVEIVIFSQAPRTSRFGTLRYLRRLLKRRGWLVFLDNLIQELARRMQKLRKTPPASRVLPESDLPECLRTDRTIAQESW